MIRNSSGPEVLVRMTHHKVLDSFARQALTVIDLDALQRAELRQVLERLIADELAVVQFENL